MPPETPPAADSSPRILIVDDHDDNVELLRARLEAWGFETEAASDGEAALSLVEQSPPDLILLDVMMPQVDGWEMLQRVRERHGVDSIQVIMFSGQVEDNGSDQAEAGGAQTFVGKPFNPQELVTRAKDLLGS